MLSGSSSPLVVLDRTFCSYGNHAALQDVSFQLWPGEIVGLLGINGAGKSTALRALAGLLQPIRGSVRFSGSSPRARRAELAYAGEADVLDPWLSPAAAMRLMGGLFADFSPERCRDLLAFLEVPERPYRRMSKGQQARFRLALALARQTRLLLLDEPLSGIDLISRERILRALLRSWNDQGTLVLSTHEVAEAEALFDRVLFLREGRLVLDARAEQLREAGKSVVQTFQELLA